MSDRYVAVITASNIARWEVRFFDGTPVAYHGDSSSYGWANDMRTEFADTLWGAKRRARRGLRALDRADRLNAKLGEGGITVE